MRNKNTKKALVLVYILFLVMLSVIFSTILLNNNAFLFNISEYFDIESKLNSNINNDGKILVDIDREMNSNGSGFIDNISCPSGTSITMSGTVNIGFIGSTLVNNGSSIYCEGTYLANPLKLYFNAGFTDIVQADYNGSIVGVTNKIGNTTFSDSDNTLIDFSVYNLNTPDLYDDDFNSDNYKVTSTGTTSTGTYYLNSFQDDDVLGRKILFGYVSPDFGFKKVLWNTPKFLEIINLNTNNNDLLNENMGVNTNGVLYFDVDKSFDIKIVTFDKAIYSSTNELYVINVEEASSGTGVLGYVQKDLTFNPVILPSSIYSFNFQNNMYAIFLKSTSDSTLLYKITGLDRTSDKEMYIVPINDSDTNIIEFLGNEILIDSNGRYISKETEIIYKK